MPPAPTISDFESSIFGQQAKLENDAQAFELALERELEILWSTPLAELNLTPADEATIRDALYYLALERLEK